MRLAPRAPPPEEVEGPTDEADMAVGAVPAGAGVPAASSTPGWLTGRKHSGAPDYSRSERYVYMAAEGSGLCDASGEVVYQHSQPWAHVGELVDAAREVAPRGELVIAVHPSAHHEIGLPERFPHEGDRPRLEFARAAMGPTTSVREIGSAGGLVVERHDAPRVLSVSRATAASSPVPPTPASWPAPLTVSAQRSGSGTPIRPRRRCTSSSSGASLVATAWGRQRRTQRWSRPICPQLGACLPRCGRGH